MVLVLTPNLRVVPRLDGARDKKQFGRPMFEPKVFRKQMPCIEESRLLATFLGLFGARRIVPPLTFRYAPAESFEIERAPHNRNETLSKRDLLRFKNLISFHAYA